VTAAATLEARDSPERRALLVASTVLATMIYTIDTTIANVALPHMQGSLQASQEQVAWVLTSYIVVSAIVTPLAGFLAVRYGMRKMLIACVSGFTIASMLCGIAVSLPEMVVFRMLQGAFGAGLIPLSQATLLNAYPRDRQSAANAIWGMGVMLGPILGPTLGGYLTDAYHWRWVFYINLPVGVLALLGLLASAPRSAPNRDRRFDGFGYLLLALAVGLTQLCVDRGSVKDWFASTEILAEAIFAGICLYMFIVHSLTTRNPFFHPGLFRDRNFAVGMSIIFVIAGLLYATMVLLPPFLEQLQGYSVMAAGLLLAPRGMGTMVSMYLCGRIGSRVDPRLMVALGIGCTAIALVQMSTFTLDVSWQPVATSGVIQGFGVGFTFVPLTTLAFSSVAPELRTEASVLYSLVRNMGSSIGISFVVSMLAVSSQANQSRLVEFFSVFDTSRWATVERVFGEDSTALLAHEIGRQAQSIAYVNDFALMLLISLAALPLLFVFRVPKHAPAVDARLALE
jgi:MFS transporter, DHA2 family, multidrug resistance protein